MTLQLNDKQATKIMIVEFYSPPLLPLIDIKRSELVAINILNISFVIIISHLHMQILKRQFGKVLIYFC